MEAKRMKTIASLSYKNEESEEIGRSRTLGNIGKSKDFTLVEELIKSPIKEMDSGNSEESRGSKTSREEIKKSICKGKIKELVETVSVFEMMKKPQQSYLK
jgi:hypothetical protein